MIKIIKSKKVIICLFFLLLLAASFSASYFYFKNLNRLAPQTQPSPTPTPVTAVSPIPKSPYATDSAILLIKDELKNLEKNLDSLDLKESQLLPPALDFEVELPENE